MLAALMRDRGRKQDDVAVADEIVENRSALARRQMLGDLERLDQVEAALEIERRGQVVGEEIIGGNRQLVGRT